MLDPLGITTLLTNFSSVLTPINPDVKSDGTNLKPKIKLDNLAHLLILEAPES